MVINHQIQYQVYTICNTTWMVDLIVYIFEYKHNFNCILYETRLLIKSGMRQNNTKGIRTG